MHPIAPLRGRRKRITHMTGLGALLTFLLLTTTFAASATAAPATSADTTAAQAASTPVIPKTLPPYDAAHMLKATITPDGVVPVYYVTTGGYLSDAHECQVLGQDPDTAVQAVECADVWAEPSGNGGSIFVFPVVEMYCQENDNSNALVQCSGAQANYGLFSPDAGEVTGGNESCDLTCSENGRNIFIDWGDYYVLSTCNLDVNGPNSVWSWIDSGASTFILTSPSWPVVALTSLASGHVIACP